MRGIFAKLFLGIIIILLLNGCCQWNNCGLVAANPSLQDDFASLRKQGIQIFRVGQTYTLVIPSNRIFNPDSANFSPDSQLVLEPLARVLRDDCQTTIGAPGKIARDENGHVVKMSHCETTYMKISGFTNNQGSSIRNKALSEKQAQQVGDYLSKQGVDARIIDQIGRGSAYPIGDNTIPSHSAWNNRIEIKFRQVVLPPLI